RRQALAALLAVLAAMFAGGSQAMVGSQGSPAKVSAAPHGTVVLNGWQVSPAEETKLASVVKAFEKSHPKIHVDYQSGTGNYQATELAKFAARKPPDLLYVDAADFADWARQDVPQ